MSSCTLAPTLSKLTLLLSLGTVLTEVTDPMPSLLLDLTHTPSSPPWPLSSSQQTLFTPCGSHVPGRPQLDSSPLLPLLHCVWSQQTAFLRLPWPSVISSLRHWEALVGDGEKMSQSQDMSPISLCFRRHAQEWMHRLLDPTSPWAALLVPTLEWPF